MSSGTTVPRTRSSDLLQYPLSKRSYWWNTSQVPKPAPPAYTQGPLIGEYKTMSDFVTPGFKRRSSSGQIFNTPMTSQRLSVHIEAVGPHFRSVVGGTTYWGEMDGPTTGILSGDRNSAILDVLTWADQAGTMPVSETMIGLASTSARAKIDEAPYEGLVALGELGETLRYLKNPFKTGLSLASALERKMMKLNSSSHKGGVASEVANLYLEFRYGVRPLVNEVESVLLAAQKSLPRPKRKTARDKQKLKSEGLILNKDVNYGGILYDQEIHVMREATARAGFLYEWVLEEGLTDHWGLKLSDVPSAAWALLPLSFVYDWFANIGDFISAVTPRAGVRHLAEWLSVRDEITVEVFQDNYRFPVAGWSTAQAGSLLATIQLRNYSRSDEVRVPSLELRNLDKLQNNALKILDLIGITHQKLGNVANMRVVRLAEQERSAKFASRVDRRLSSSPTDGRASAKTAAWLKYLGSL